MRNWKHPIPVKIRVYSPNTVLDLQWRRGTKYSHIKNVLVPLGMWMRKPVLQAHMARYPFHIVFFRDPFYVVLKVNSWTKYV